MSARGYNCTVDISSSNGKVIISYKIWKMRKIKTLTWLCIANHFYATSIASHKRRLIPRKCGVIERILASQIRPRVAFVAINRTSCKTQSQWNTMFIFYVSKLLWMWIRIEKWFEHRLIFDNYIDKLYIYVYGY